MVPASNDSKRRWPPWIIASRYASCGEPTVHPNDLCPSSGGACAGHPCGPGERAREDGRDMPDVVGHACAGPAGRTDSQTQAHDLPAGGSTLGFYAFNDEPVSRFPLMHSCTSAYFRATRHPPLQKREGQDTNSHHDDHEGHEYSFCCSPSS